MYEIMAEDTFASAHQLKGYEGPCENLHGHTWKVQVFMAGEALDRTGMLFDFKTAKTILKEILFEFDHKNLNEMEMFMYSNPTAENIARVIFGQFNDKIKEMGNNVGSRHGGTDRTDQPKLEKVVVWESERTCATYHS